VDQSKWRELVWIVRVDVPGAALPLAVGDHGPAALQALLLVAIAGVAVLGATALASLGLAAEFLLAGNIGAPPLATPGGARGLVGDVVVEALLVHDMIPLWVPAVLLAGERVRP
jgi:hypothetical protein